MDGFKKEVWKAYLPFIALLGILIVSVIIRILPYLLHNYFFEVGFDTGYYENVLTRYVEAERWTRAPAYPPMTDQEAYPIEPGFFIITTFIFIFNSSDVNLFFRFFLPSVMGILLSLGMYLVLFERSNGNRWLGIFGALMVALSYVQVEAINSAYYRQIFATFILLIAISRFDLLLGKGGRRGIIFQAFTIASLLAIHRAVFLIYVIIIISYFIYNVLTKHKEEVRSLAYVTIIAFIISAPLWVFTIEYQIWTASTIIQDSLTGISDQMSNGINYQGGGVIENFSRNNALESYLFLLPSLFIIGTAGAIFSIKNRLDRPMLIGFAFLLVYVGFWFAFGNRLIINFDIIIIYFSCILLLTISKFHRLRIKWRKITIPIVVAILMITPTMFLFDTQTEIKPIITQNIDGVRWIDENIAKDGILIFSPDYLSVSLMQMGYEVAFIDYRLSIDGSRPPIINEIFLNQSAFNDTYLESFFTLYGWTSDLDIYVIWGTRELTSTLPNTGLMIPQEKYEASPWYELKYSGRDEILSVYQLHYY